MGLTICVSPEAGWSELETFLGATRKRLTVAMYQFTAPHVFKAVEDAVTPGHRTFELVLHPFVEPPTAGVKAHDLKTKTEVLKPLDNEMTDRFDHTWATFKTKATRRAVGVVVSHQGRGPRRQCGLVVERQLAVVEPAERASVR